MAVETGLVAHGHRDEQSGLVQLNRGMLPPSLGV
jgi:hypothetical protein